jgi:hypothetical protein
VVPSGPPGGARTRPSAPNVWEHAGQERKCFFLNTLQPSYIDLLYYFYLDCSFRLDSDVLLLINFYRYLDNLKRIASEVKRTNPSAH